MEPHLIKFRPDQWQMVIAESHRQHISMAAFVRNAVGEKLLHKKKSLPAHTNAPDTSG